MDSDRFPLLGYAIINGVVIVLTLAAWYAAKTGLFLFPTAEGADRPGVAAMLILVPLCFLLASVFDMAWRALSRRSDATPQIPEPPRVSSSSPNIKRDLSSREIEKV